MPLSLSGPTPSNCINSPGIFCVGGSVEIWASLWPWPLQDSRFKYLFEPPTSRTGLVSLSSKYKFDFFCASGLVEEDDGEGGAQAGRPQAVRRLLRRLQVRGHALVPRQVGGLGLKTKRCLMDFLECGFIHIFEGNAMFCWKRLCFGRKSLVKWEIPCWKNKVSSTSFQVPDSSLH